MPRRFLLLAALVAAPAAAADPPLPAPGTLRADPDRGELVLGATVQFPAGKECINTYGQRIQAFVGCGKAAGGDATMAGYFVFLVDVPAEDVHAAMLGLGCRPRVSYGIHEGRKRVGWKPTTTAADFLQGDPVALSVFWAKPGGGWVERPYQSFVTERVAVDGAAVEKPWTPHFVYHGSGAMHKSGTGCLACPCDCAGGLIADNRNPLYEPKPVVRFDMEKAPPAGTRVYVRLRPTVTRE